MKKLNSDERKDLVNAAMGRIQFDLLIKNITMLNVFSNEIYPVEIGIKHRYIAFIENRTKYFNCDKNAQKVIDGKGKLAVPGFIDSHMHVESSMLTPGHFAQLAIPRGTTTIVTDPHEIGNVMGIRGVKYMVEAGKVYPMYQYALAPSCVPAVPSLESSGAVFGVEEIEQLLDIEGIIGVAEVMDYIGVINNSKRMRSILDLALKNKVFIQGHFFSKEPRELAAYLCAGPKSNHEIRNGEDALSAIRSGMIVDAKDSSFAKTIEPIIKKLNHLGPLSNLTLCTDDREPEDIRENGHIDDCIRIAIKAGLAPIDAIKAATISTSKLYGLNDLGALAPGYIANINLIDNIESVCVDTVFFEGDIVAKNNLLTHKIENTQFPIENENTIYLDNFSKDKLLIKAPIHEGHVDVRVINHINLQSSVTEELIKSVSIKNGYISLHDNKDLNYIAIFNRHQFSNNYSTGLIRNFHLNNGALAGTVGHDSHNLAVVYTNIADAEKAVEIIKKIKGGIVYVCGEIIQYLALPVAGLMSQLPSTELTPVVEKMNKLLSTVGIKAYNPVMRIATVSLPVVPNIKITDMGLVNTIDQSFLNLFV